MNKSKDKESKSIKDSNEGEGKEINKQMEKKGQRHIQPNVFFFLWPDIMIVFVTR